MVIVISSDTFAILHHRQTGTPCRV